MRHTLAVLTAAAILLLAGCSTSSTSDAGTKVAPSSSEATSEAVVEATQPPLTAPLDLAGEWKQTNSNSADAYQAATISADQILINWVNDKEFTTAIYWAGTYVAPTSDASMYTWNSVNDTAQTDNALLASSDPTKVFTFQDGVLTYELTAMGVTMTVEMSRQ